jgi:hypothetical protein
VRPSVTMIVEGGATARRFAASAGTKTTFTLQMNRRHRHAALHRQTEPWPRYASIFFFSGRLVECPPTAACSRRRSVNDLVGVPRDAERQPTPAAGATPRSLAAISYERLLAAEQGAHNWPIVRGNLPGHALLRAEADRRHRTCAVWQDRVGPCPIPGDQHHGSRRRSSVGRASCTCTGSGNPLTVTALDAKNGRQIGATRGQQPVRNPYENNRFNRGVAMLGNRLFVGTLGAVLNRASTRATAPCLECQMADTMEATSMTSPPLVVKDKVVMAFRRRVRDSRLRRRVRRATRQARLALLHDPRLRAIRPRPRGRATAGRGAAVRLADGRPTTRRSIELYIRWATRRRKSIDPSVATASTISSRFRRRASIRTRVSACGTTNSRRNDGHDWDSSGSDGARRRVWRGQIRKLPAARGGGPQRVFHYVLDRTNGSFCGDEFRPPDVRTPGFDANGVT